MMCFSWSKRWLAPLVGLLVLGLLVFYPAGVDAHERRKIAGDKAEAVVGWLVEPAYVDQPNGIDFRITNLATKEPIEGLEKSVKVEVTHGGVTRQFDLRARFGQKGAYTADLIPTRTGDYTFRFTGEIDGAKVDERFESGPGRFNSIQPLSTAQFPSPQPSMGDLQRELSEARAAADTARTIGTLGAVTGLLGLLLGAAALRRRPSTQAPVPSVPRP